jgi:hypothetical protein
MSASNSKPPVDKTPLEELPNPSQDQLIFQDVTSERNDELARTAGYSEMQVTQQKLEMKLIPVAF